MSGAHIVASPHPPCLGSYIKNNHVSISPPSLLGPGEVTFLGCVKKSSLKSALAQALCSINCGWQEGGARVKSEAEGEPSLTFLPFRQQAWASSLNKDLQVIRVWPLCWYIRIVSPFSQISVTQTSLGVNL
jgi:hypothetical protein